MGTWSYVYILIVNFFSIIFVYLMTSKKYKDWGKTLLSLIFRNKGLSIAEYEEFISQLGVSLKWLSNYKVGALIVVQKYEDLQKYIDLGYILKSKFNAEFVINVFSNKKSALHDGGLIIQGFNISSVSSYFPITKTRMVTTFGARHRAATGITEETDSIAFMVSETTGFISYAKKGKLYSLEREDVNTLCEQLFAILNFYIK